MTSVGGFTDCSHPATGVCSGCVGRRRFAFNDVRSNSCPPAGTAEAEELTPTASFEMEGEMAKMTILPFAAGKNSSDLHELSHAADNFINKELATTSKDLEADDSIPLDKLSPDVAPSSSNWLWRFFDSSYFNTSLAIFYLWKRPTHPSTLQYLGEKLHNFPDEEVDFYIPQLINLYIHHGDVAEAIHPYITKRCEENGQVALLCCWLLEAFGGEDLKYEEKRHGEKLRQWILNTLNRPKDSKGLTHSRSLSTSLLSPDSLHRLRPRSDMGPLGSFGNLSTGHAFDDGCTCFIEEPKKQFCECDNLGIRGEKEFIKTLVQIGNTLKEVLTKEEKSRRLVSELAVINGNLPARVWLPLYWDQHVILRIPQNSGCVLNSKDKAPYCIYVEVLRCDSARKVRVPAKRSDTEAEIYQKMRGPASNPSSTNQTPPNCRPPFDDKGISCDIASDTLSQRSLDSCNSDEKISAREISNRLKNLAKRPKRQMRHTPEDPSAFAMSEPWEEKKERLRQSSPYGRMAGWDLLPVIVKSGDDLRQEMLAYQLLQMLNVIWNEEKVPVWIRPYKICVLSQDAGLIEPIVDACSLHQIKRNQQVSNTEEGKMEPPSLLAHFQEHFGNKDSDNFVRAQQNFVESCAAYSLACYFLQVKDRHNGNILVDSEGHLIHIDFGFILSASPKNLGFESSPFKLTSEYTDVMGGLSSSMFLYYRALMLQGLLAARKHHERIMNIVEIMAHAGSPLPCFRGGEATVKAMRARFHMNCTENQLKAEVDKMIEQSRDAFTTRLYDSFQYYTNNIW